MFEEAHIVAMRPILEHFHGVIDHFKSLPLFGECSHVVYAVIGGVREDVVMESVSCEFPTCSWESIVVQGLEKFTTRGCNEIHLITQRRSCTSQTSEKPPSSFISVKKRKKANKK